MEYFYGAHTHAMDTSTQCWYKKLMPHRGSSNKPTRWRSSFGKMSSPSNKELKLNAQLRLIGQRQKHVYKTCVTYVKTST